MLLAGIASRQNFCQISSRIRIIDSGDLFRTAAGDHITALVAAFGPKIDDVICRLDDIQVVLDNDDGIACFHQLIEDPQQFADVIGMQTGGRFIKNIDRFTASSLAKFTGKLDALGFTARQGTGRSVEGQVVEDVTKVDIRRGAERDHRGQAELALEKQIAEEQLVQRQEELVEVTAREAQLGRSLELTERDCMDHEEATHAVLSELRDFGVRIHMDDFGTGYSSLSYLQRCAYDTLKIDRSFVQSLGSEDQSLAIVRTIVGLGRMLNMNVVAEGVESQSQIDALISLQCPEAQGFWFSRPVPPTEAGELLRKARSAGH